MTTEYCTTSVWNIKGTQNHSVHSTSTSTSNRPSIGCHHDILIDRATSTCHSMPYHIVLCHTHSSPSTTTTTPSSVHNPFNTQSISLGFSRNFVIGTGSSPQLRPLLRPNPDPIPCQSNPINTPHALQLPLPTTPSSLQLASTRSATTPNIRPLTHSLTQPASQTNKLPTDRQTNKQSTATKDIILQPSRSLRFSDFFPPAMYGYLVFPGTQCH